MKLLKSIDRFSLAFYGTGLLCTLTALVLSAFYRPGFWFAFPIANGFSIGLFGSLLVEQIAKAKSRKMIERLPANVQMLERSDDKLVVAVTRNNGETSIVDLPADYDPRVDNAETLMRIVNPELFEEE